MNLAALRAPDGQVGCREKRPGIGQIEGSTTRVAPGVA